MNFRSLILSLAGAGALIAADPRLLQIRQVYVLPMSGGLDQYLANRLTQSGRYMVVTDASKADALLTDSIGVAFEEKYKELYPPPAPPPVEAAKGEAAAKKGDDRSLVSAMGGGASAPPRTSSFSRGKGNVFLVDRSSRQVIWSTYLRPRNKSASELDRTADQIIDRMDDAAEGREKAERKAAKASGAASAPAAPAQTPAPEPPAAPAPAAAPAK